MKTILTHAFAILLACLVAMPMFAAKQKKVKQKKCPPLTHVGNKYYCEDVALKESEMLDFYAQHNCQEAYDLFKRGRQCSQAGWTFLAVGLASTSVSLGCGIAYAVEGFGSIINAYGNGGSGRRYRPDKALADASLAMGVIATATTITCIPLLKVGKKKIQLAEETYNAVCAGKRKYTPQAYWSIQTSGNGLGIALNF